MGDPLRILVVHPGASTSVSDVHRGVLEALQARPDVAVAEYELGGRLSYQAEWLRWLYRRAKRRAPGADIPHPTPTDVVKRATRDVPSAAWAHRADWVLVITGMYLHPDMLATLRWYGRPRVAVLFTESPYDDGRQLPLVPFCDVCWTQERRSLPAFREWCQAAGYLPVAYNAAVHHVAPADPEVPAHDVVFVGTGFRERIALLSSVDWMGLGIDLGLYGNWEYLPSRHPLRRHVRAKAIPNTQAVELYRRAKVGLNLYRTSTGWGREAPPIAEGAAESLNPRAYELAACGVFSVSDWRPEVSEVFGDLLPTFRDPSDLGPLLMRWLADDVGRAQVQAQLPARVTAHTYVQRVEQMVADLRAATRRQAAA